MPPRKPPPEFRRRANRPALSRRQLGKGKLSPELLAAARRGVLTRTNTAKGTQGRQAVDRAKGYAPRAARRAPGETVRARLGHAPAPEVLWSAVPTTSGVIGVLTTTRRESSRLGIYSHDVGLLLAGDMESTDFERKWRRRKRDIGTDVELEWRADVVVALDEAWSRRWRRPPSRCDRARAARDRAPRRDGRTSSCAADTSCRRMRSRAFLRAMAIIHERTLESPRNFAASRQTATIVSCRISSLMPRSLTTKRIWPKRTRP
jgi:hypothetical protein